MPDTYKTFLSPGSCQLEVTDLVAAANDDTGVDLYGVAWEIEQVLIAGEGFAASPTDVWVNERGVLNIGQSLFDKINRTAEDNDNVPGQCTVIVKATSLVDSSKIARMKILVGYPGEGGGGGGGAETTDLYIWNATESDDYMDVLPTGVKYLTGLNWATSEMITVDLEFEQISEHVISELLPDGGLTFHGVKVSNVPCGAFIVLELESNYQVNDQMIGYAEVSDPSFLFENDYFITATGQNVAYAIGSNPLPIAEHFNVATYTVFPLV